MMLETVVTFIVQAVADMGYLGIVLLMALESSFFPFPSEVVVPPAGYLAARGEMNIWLVTLAGTGGSLIGALGNYFLSLWLGRAFIERWGRYVFLPQEKFEKVEMFFTKHGEITTFVGRLLPGIRQYISLPAGMSRMNLARFSFYTGLGAGIWVIVLAWVGFFVGNNIELVKSYTHEILLIMFPVLIVLIAAYVWNHRRKNGRPD